MPRCEEGNGKLCVPSFLRYHPPVKNAELLLASNTLLKEHGGLGFILWVKKNEYLYFSEIEGEIFLNIIYRSKEKP